MRAKSTTYIHLTDEGSREIARLSALAVANTVHGGASAMVEAKEIAEKGSILWESSPVTPDEVVSDAYCSSSGRASERFGAFECYECGHVHLGREAADFCCSPAEEEEQAAGEIAHERGLGR